MTETLNELHFVYESEVTHQVFEVRTGFQPLAGLENDMEGWVALRISFIRDQGPESMSFTIWYLACEKRLLSPAPRFVESDVVHEKAKQRRDEAVASIKARGRRDGGP